MVPCTGAKTYTCNFLQLACYVDIPMTLTDYYNVLSRSSRQENRDPSTNRKNVEKATVLLVRTFLREVCRRGKPPSKTTSCRRVWLLHPIRSHTVQYIQLTIII